MVISPTSTSTTSSSSVNLTPGKTRFWEFKKPLLIVRETEEHIGYDGTVRMFAVVTGLK